MFYFKDNKQLTVYFADGNSAVWQADNPQFDRVLELCKSNNWIQIEMLHNQAKVLLNNKVSIQGDKLTIETVYGDAESLSLDKGQGDKLTVDLGTADESDPIIAFIKLLKDKGTIDTEIERIKPFLKNMFMNPFINAATEIYDYCKAMDFEITEDGYFIAYKNVRADLGSVYDNGRTKHVIGQPTKVDKFDTNRANECSQGLHFCSRGFLSCYSGEVTLVMKINPADVVSIPRDYNHQKGRCREYIPIGILGKDGTLSTTDIEAMTDGEVKVVKTKARAKAERKLAEKKAKSGNRIDETVSLMKTHKDNVEKVAKIMKISVETVKRNIRKYNQRNKR